MPQQIGLTQSEREAIRQNLERFRKGRAPRHIVEQYLSDEGVSMVDIYGAPTSGTGVNVPPEKQRSGVRGMISAVSRGATLGGQIPGQEANPLNAIRKRQGMAPIDFAAENEADYESFRDEHPVASTLAELGGSLATGKPFLGMGKAIARKAGTKMGGRMLAGSATGATASGLYGANTAEGQRDLSDLVTGERPEPSFVDQMKGFVKGATIGGLTGGVLPPIASGVGRVTRMAVPAGAPSRVAGRALTKMGATGVGQRLMDQGEETAQRHAANILGKKSGLTPQEFAQAGTDELASYPRSEARAMDLGGRNVRQLAQTTSSLSDDAREGLGDLLETRGATRNTRALREIQEAAGVPTGDPTQLADDLLAQRSAHAEQLYQPAFERTPIVDDKRVDKLMKLPLFKRAMEKAEVRLANEGKKLPTVTRSVRVKLKNGDYGLAKRRVPVASLRQLHYAKMAIDDAIDQGFAGNPLDTRSLAKSDAEIARKIQEKLLKVMDDVSGDYAVARNQFAGETQTAKALKSGRGLMSDAVDERVAAREAAALHPSDQELYRTGGVDAVSRLAQKGQDIVRRSHRRPIDQAKLRTLAKDQTSADALDRRLASEFNQSQTERTVLGGSPTQPRGAAQADFEQLAVAVGKPGSAMSFGFGATAIRFLSNQIRKRYGDMVGDVAGRVSKLLQAKPGTPEWQELLRLLNSSGAPNMRENERRAAYLLSAMAGQ